MPGPAANAAQVDPLSRAWITLITNDSYLPGVIILVHTLYKHKSQHPILLEYTSSLSASGIECLQDLAALYSSCRLVPVEPVALPDGHASIATRFNDTLTKLRAFQPLEDALSPEQFSALRLNNKTPERCCFLDADIAIFKNMDDIFDIPLPAPDYIACHHACVCNIDHDPWAPPEWNQENCPCTTYRHPSALDAPPPRPRNQAQESTYKLLNSGVFVCIPSSDTWKAMDQFRLTDPRVRHFAFPDQNFLDTFFQGKWVPIGWQYNALKTHRYWHPDMWRDNQVRALHYIVDKPWQKRVGEGGCAGYLGRDGVTHQWWWDEYELWKRELGALDETRVRLLAAMDKHIARPDEFGRGDQDIIRKD